MEIIDHIFIVMLFVVQPVYGLIESRRNDANERAGKPFDRILFYRQTVLMEWAFLLALVAAWAIYSRPMTDLGFISPGGPGFWVGAAFLLGFTGYLLYMWRAFAMADDVEKARHKSSFGNTTKYLPHTSPELRSFVGVSVTAGIVEEIVYRGFVFWYLGQFMPLWAVVIVSSLAFGLAHSYQGASGALRCGLLGLAFATLYVVTGSIWLPILAHVLLDVIQGAAVVEILRKDDERAAPNAA